MATFEQFKALLGDIKTIVGSVKEDTNELLDALDMLEAGKVITQEQLDELYGLAEGIKSDVVTIDESVPEKDEPSE